MPTYNKSWDENVPDGGDSVNLGDNAIRAFKEAIRERLATDHEFEAIEGSNANIGYHNKNTLLRQSSDPAALATALILYAKLSGSFSELFSMHENTGIQRLTNVGKLWLEALGMDSEAKGDLAWFDGGKWTRFAKGLNPGDQIRVNSANDGIEYFTPSAALSTGTILIWGSTYAAVPAGYLSCDGAAVSRTTYSGLFAVIGTQYGVGDNSTTFNLPDLKDKFPIGANSDDSGTAKSLITGSLAKSGGSLDQPPLTSTTSGGGATGSNPNNIPPGHNHEFIPPFLALAFMIKT